MRWTEALRIDAYIPQEDLVMVGAAVSETLGSHAQKPSPWATPSTHSFAEGVRRATPRTPAANLSSTNGHPEPTMEFVHPRADAPSALARHSSCYRSGRIHSATIEGFVDA